jgi:hypothetical protein
MNVVIWAPVVSAAVAIASGSGAVYSWFRARGEREEAARQAKAATDSASSAAGSLKQVAELLTRRDERQQAREAAVERDPWSPQRDGNELRFVNDSATPKHGVNVKIFANDQPWIDETFPYVGPGRPVEIDSYVAISAEMRAEITWHLEEKLTDNPSPQTITW